MNENRVSYFFRKVYFWMFFGLILSTITAFLVVSIPAFTAFVYANMMVFFGLIIAELILVIVLVAAIKKLSSTAAKLIFVLYSLLNGLTISVVLLFYTGASVATTFFVAAVMFGAMALYGFTTKKDLTRFGPMLFMALIGLIVAMIVNFFLKSSVFDLIISFIGVLLFTALTAYDNQYLKKLASTFKDEETLSKYSVIGALKLYLDFINLFLFLLRLLGKRR